jgi:DNA-binding Xre family transcriptional regulator
MSFAIEVVDRLKQILRTKGLSYRELAKGIGMSEAAVKRAFSERAFSLKRIEEICEFLKLSTHDLLDTDSSSEALSRVLTEAQELALASDEKLMCFFYLLASGHSLTRIKGRYRFTEPEITRNLIALDRVRLIRLDPGNRFKLLVEQDFYWPKGGVLEAYYSREIRRDFAEHPFSGARTFELFAAGALSDASLNLVRRRLQELEDDVRKMIRLDRRYQESETSNITIYCAFRPWTLPLMKKYRRKDGH